MVSSSIQKEDVVICNGCTPEEEVGCVMRVEGSYIMKSTVDFECR